MAAIVASVPPLVLLASTHLTVILIRSTTPPPDNDQPVPVEAAEDEMPRLDVSEQPVAITAEPRQQPESEEPVPVASELIAEQESPAFGPGTETASHPEPAADPEPTPRPEIESSSPPQRASAESTRSGKDADRRTRAEGLREAGWSNKAIARELGVHASTVGRWFTRTPTTEENTEGARS